MLRNDPLWLQLFYFDADPDLAFHFDADPDPASKNDAETSCNFIWYRFYIQ